MKTHFIRLICFLVCPAGASGLEGATPPGELEEYIRSLQVHFENKTFLTIRDDFREHLIQDSDGSLLRRMLRSPDLRKMLFANLDAPPNKYQDLILAEFLEDEANWSSMGDLFYSPAVGIALKILARFDPQGWLDHTSLTLALAERTDRLAISSVLRNLSEELEFSTDTETQEIIDAARDEIVVIVATPPEKHPSEDEGG